MRVLVIEDDEEMAGTIAVGPRRAQMTVDTALDGPSGYERAVINDYDVIVIDRGLPGMHGDEICTKLIAVGCRSRVLMLTAASTMEDLVDGLGLGPTPSRSRSAGYGPSWATRLSSRPWPGPDIAFETLQPATKLK